MATTSQYYRVKRHTQTIFINSANPNSEKVLDLKHKIVKALASTKNPDPVAAAVSAPADIQLSVLPAKSSPGSASSPAGGQYTPLVDSKTLQASGLVDQQVIAMTLKTRDGTWEEVSIVQPEALADLDDLEDEPEEVEAVRSAKGKERA
ncbi:hypothetical protein CPC16_008346 [Podila verticillata]|nr:hypothetical protein BGZ59_008926 [Podila verticillata]KAF9384674.1 hypothetical protein CPC16_008346 [Podila verticillata]KAI9242597.1 MAG: hypothetical protein BYD32DRAFT_402839 [Podila humilis]KFH67471.1 hypothetical protein MVEG_06203 [Podila verticillata NRRL 6337]